MMGCALDCGSDGGAQDARIKTSAPLKAGCDVMTVLPSRVALERGATPPVARRTRGETPD